MTVLTSRRWQIAWWGNLFVGAAFFVVCIWDSLSYPWALGAFFFAYLTGFLAAVLVEIGTQ